MAKKRLADVIVLLPGITGSVLQRDGRELWAMSGGVAWQALTSLGGSLRSLQLDGADPGGVVATQLMPDAHIVPGLVKIDGYADTARMVTETFDVIGGSTHERRPANFIEFPYDWRLDNRVNARRLAALVKDRLALWRSHSGIEDARVIVLAHSMGGLVARYWLEVLEGWRDCRALITFGTPYRGSVDALGYLANGYKRLFVDLTEAMRSFPSVHQLLPIYPALSVGADWLRVAEAGDVPGINRTLAHDALAFHREIEAAVNEHANDSDYVTSGYTILPVVGTCQPTMQSATIANGELAISSELPSGVDEMLADGDGRVPRASAIPIELSNAYRDSFVPEQHSSLQRNRSVLNDIRGRLEQMQVRGLRKLRGPEERPQAAEGAAIALELDDMYRPGEPVTLRVSLINSDASSGPPRAHLTRVRPPDAAPVSYAFVETSDGWVSTIEGLPPGLYRVEVRTLGAGPFAPPPVHDLFEIAG